MNKVFLIGNLTRDPEVSETSGGVSVCHFSIAVNRSYTSSDGERQTDFFNVTAWRGLADTVGRYAKRETKSPCRAASRCAPTKTTRASSAQR